MKTVKKYTVEIIKDRASNKYRVEEFKILLENEDYLVIDNFNFQSLRKSGRDKEMETPIIFSMNYGIASHDGIYYHYYTLGTHRAETIKREIADWINKKYGFMMNINLDFIKEEV